MSWSINGMYRNVEHAKASVLSQQLPQSIKDYIAIGLDGIQAKDNPVSIVGNGHLCYLGAGGGNYELTSAQLEVKPLVFAP